MSGEAKDSFTRTIKILADSLDKTRKRVQARFDEVDERMDKIEATVTSLQDRIVKISSSTMQGSPTTSPELLDKIAKLEARIEELEKKAVAPRASSVPYDSHTNT